MNDTAHPYIYGVFPYLKTRERIRLRGVEFRSSDDLDDVAPGPREHLKALCAMFFLGDGVQIRRMTCAAIPAGIDPASRHEAMRAAYEAQLLVGYLYSSPHPSGGVFLPAESSTLFLFRPDRVPASLAWHEPGEGADVAIVREPRKSESGFLEGYEGRRNDAAHLWVAGGSRVYPELPHQVLNLSQTLAEDVYRFLERDAYWAFRRLYLAEDSRQIAGAVRDRVFSGLEWYLRGCRRAISESEALVHLAIALEGLLRVPAGERLTERFKDAVLTLIGPVPRLDSWLDQFYAARSKAVHEGVPHELMFFAVDQDQLRKKQPQGGEPRIPHRSLIEYGRRIFRLCLTNLVSAAENADAISLDRLFVHNGERVQAICRALARRDEPADDRLREIEATVHELHEFQGILAEPHVGLDDVLAAARLMADVFSSSDPTLTDEARAAIAALRDEAVKKAKGSEKLAAMERAMQALRDVGGTRTGRHDVVIRFLEYATGHAFSLRCLFEGR
jgi:hypothetical protein